MTKTDRHGVIIPPEEFHDWQTKRSSRPARISKGAATLAAVAVFVGSFTGAVHYPASALASEMRPLIAEIGEAALQLADRSTALSTEYAQRASAALANIHIASGIEFSPHLQLAQAAAADTADSFTSYVGSLWRQLVGAFSQIVATPEYVRTPGVTEPAMGSSTTTPTCTVGTTAVAPIQQTIINQPVIERVVSVPAAPGISQLSLAGQLQSLRDDLLNRIASIAAPSYPPQLAPATFQALALSQRIDQLNGTAITNPAITGGTISGTHISADSFSLSGILSLASAIFDSLTATTLTATNATTTRLDAFDYVAVGGSATTTIRGDGVASTIPYASSTAVSVSGTASTSNLIASTGFTFKTVTGFLKATAGVVATALIDLAADVTGILPVANGGTGWAAIQSGTIPYGNGSSAFATSSAFTFDGTKLVATYASTTALTTSGSTYLATSAGNVGIGTTSPSAKLSVEGGNVLIGNAQAYQMRQSNGTAINALGMTSSNHLQLIAGAAGSVLLYPDGGNDGAGLAVINNGNVGIGTASPNYRLTVDSGANGASAGSVFHSDTYGALFESESNSTSHYVLNVKSGVSSTIGSGGSSLLYVRNDGNVGIGTVSPGAKLEISDDVATLLSESDYVVKVTDPTGDTSLLLGVSATCDAALIQALDPSTSWATRNLALQVNGGNVGIGTTTPWRNLSVTGTVGFDGLTGATGAGSLCLDANKQVVYNSGSDSCLSSTRITKHDITDLALSGINTVAALRSVSFIYNNDASSTVRYGFIAEDTAAVDAHFATYDAQGNVSGVDDRSLISILVKAVQEILATIAGLAESFTTKQLCVADDAGKTCISRSQLQALLGGQPSPQTSDPTSPTTGDTTTPPSIHIAGENPATIHVGDTYADLGAIATDSQGHDLSYRTFINGILAGDIVIDTSATATDTIDYVATDTWGNTATSTRTVIIEAVAATVVATDANTATSSATSSPSGR